MVKKIAWFANYLLFIENNIASDIRLSRNVVNKESKRSRRFVCYCDTSSGDKISNITSDIIFDTISAMSNIFSITYYFLCIFKICINFNKSIKKRQQKTNPILSVYTLQAELIDTNIMLIIRLANHQLPIVTNVCEKHDSRIIDILQCHAVWYQASIQYAHSHKSKIRITIQLFPF